MPERGREAAAKAERMARRAGGTAGRAGDTAGRGGGLFIFARFHAHPGNEGALEEALRDNLAPTRTEPGCMYINLFRSIRDPRLFYIHSRFKDEAAFEHHAILPHTVRMIERVEPLIDHPFDATRAESVG